MNNKNKPFNSLLGGGLLAILPMILVISKPSLTEENKPEWGDGGASNPSRWSEVSAEFEACKSGRDQSPIDIGIAEEERNQSKSNLITNKVMEK